MPALNPNVAQDLNNAIYSLASLNPSNPIAGNLNEAWQSWFSTARNVLPDIAWWSTFKGFWAAYAAARVSASTLSVRTPPPSDIDPTLWKTLLSDVQSRGELLADAGRATGEAIASAARPVLLVAGLIAVGLLVTQFRGRR